MNREWLDEAASLGPTTYVHYLRSRGWRQVDVAAHFPFTRFQLQVGDQVAEVDVANDSKLGDYRRRIGEVVEVLMAVERASWPEIYVRLCNPSVDEFRLRLVGGDLVGGRIGLDDAIRLRVARRQLLLAAAHSVVDPRAHFPRLAFADPLGFLSQCRELPVIPGSWISSIQIPIEPELADDSPVPYSRKVTEMLARALSSVAYALGKDGEDRLLHGAEQGISSNFLAALAQLRPVTELGSLEIESDLVSDSYAAEYSLADSPIWLRELRSVPKRLQVWLREHTSVEDVGLEGHVISLARDDQGTGASQGADHIVVLAEIEEHKPIRVSVHVPAEDHTVVVRAYHEGARVGIRGTLTREGRVWRLERPGPVRLLTAAQDDPSEF